jgi:hypothetical protein
VRPRYGSVKAIGISLGSVQRIWRAYKLQPHRLRTFKRSRDPSFAAKLTDIVGLDVIGRPTLWCSCSDERAQIQALDRTRPGLPIKPATGRGDFWNIRSQSTHPRLRNKGFERCRIGVPAAAGQME